jgi:hypothetical protein
MTESETRWREIVGEWRSSGLTPEAFARDREFKASTLVYWASRLRRAEGGAVGRAGEAAVGVRMVRVVAQPSASAGVTVRVGAASVVVQTGFDAALLRQVVEALGGVS